MIQRDEVLLKNNQEWLHFAKPHRIISAANLGEVRAALQEVEYLVNTNGWYAAGFVSYESAPAFDNALQVISSDDFPLLWFGLYPEPASVKLPDVEVSINEMTWLPSVDRETYNSAIEKVKEKIAAGRTYQVNYTMRLRSEAPADEWNFFLHLAQSQNKYAAYIDAGRYVICSASPELFFKLDGEKIFSRPMKGTVKRGRTNLEDKELSTWLNQSIKNHAENVMIVDMIRNDLGRIAKVGSVHVPDLFTIEKYPTLLQMTSTVQAKTEASLNEIFSALFPCASITGAPKVSTMKIIADLETTPRKLYTGSIGYIFPNRKAQFSVAIRTALIDRDTRSAEYGVGGGIVWDSTSADEYREALLKARVLTDPPQKDFSLFETILWNPQEGFYLRENHIRRLCDSAKYFDFRFSKEELELFLDQLEKGFDSPQRVKVSLDRNGKITSEHRPLPETKPVLTACLAIEPIDSRNVFLFHKTTQRQVYTSAHEARPNCDEVLLYNAENELTEFTIGNLVVELDGQILTPPTKCGLLAGTYRERLLETGEIMEQVIHTEDLKKCSKIFMVNSVRKWVEVNLLT
ncbi:MAG: aminodeoxychorismate synthase component I [Anaerolineales bacterium]|nr:aminodeoxychorismate synthase component I [Anaerolineales bacterium]